MKATAAGRNFDRWTVIVTAILLAALVTRLGWLSLRPLHHDEGVNYWFAQRIIDTGTYAYDPTNYHGPTFFFALFFSFLALGVSEFSLRFPTAVFGIALIVLPLLWPRWPRALVAAAAVLLLTSPSVTYFSRYAIHETLLVSFSLAAVLLAAAIIERQDLRYLPVLGAVAALLLTTKETAVIMFAMLGVIGLAHGRRLGAMISRRGSVETIVLSLGIFALTYSALFSSWFTNRQGLIDSFQSFAPWLSRGVEGGGHDKPWHYYLMMIARYELPLLLLGTAGLRYAWRSTLGRSVALWFLVSAATYSLIDYKTPWLVVNLTVPLAWLAAVGYHGLPWRGLVRGLLAGGCLYLAAMSLNFNGLQTWQDGNPYAYEHSHTSLLEMVGVISDLGPAPRRVMVHTDEYWPLPFYLRRDTVAYLSSATAADFSDVASYDAVIFPDRTISSSQVPTGYRRARFRLRNGVALELVSRAP